MAKGQWWDAALAPPAGGDPGQFAGPGRPCNTNPGCAQRPTGQRPRPKRVPNEIERDLLALKLAQDSDLRAAQRPMRLVTLAALVGIWM